MANNNDPKKTRPGEMPQGTFHFNPGNMSGKKIGNSERHADDLAGPLDEGIKKKDKTERSK